MASDDFLPRGTKEDNELLKKRDKPLYSMRGLMERNRIFAEELDGSQGEVFVIDGKGNRVKLDKNFNLFDRSYLS